VNCTEKVNSKKFSFLMLLLLLGFNSFRPDWFLPGGRVLTYVPTILTALLLLQWCLEKKKTVANIQTKLFFILCVFIVLQTPFARNSGASFRVIKGFLLYQLTLYLFMVQFIDSFQRINKFIRLYTVFAVFPAVIGIAGGGVVFNIPTLLDENDFCLFVNCMVPFAFFLAILSEKIKLKWFYMFLVLIFVIANIASFSRGGFIGLLAIVFYLFWGSRKKIFFIVLVVVVGAAIVKFSPPRYLAEISSIDSNSYERDTGAERLTSWEAAWEMFIDHPIVGVGVNNYGPWLPDYWQGERRSSETMWGRVAHSLYFTLLPELGLVGSIIFIGMLLGNYKDHKFICNLERNKKQYLAEANLEKEEKERIGNEISSLYFISKAYCGAMVAYLVTGIFISVLWYYFFWTLTAFWVLTGNYARKTEKQLISSQG